MPDLLAALSLLLLLPSCFAPPAIKGHLEPLFRHNPSSPVPVHIGYPPPSFFVLNHFVPDVPLVMRNSRQLRNWTDAYLHKKLPNVDVDVTEALKKTNTSETFQSSFQDFLKDYRGKPWHLISRMPPALARETLLPYPLQCPGLDGAFNELMLSMTGAETKSQLQYDSESQFFCVERGSNEVMLVNATAVEGFLNEIIDMKDATVSNVDVDKVDLKKYPQLQNLHYFKANLTPGDCLFIPLAWLYYFHTGPQPYAAFSLSLDKNSARGSLKGIAKSCRKTPDGNLTLAKVRFQFDDDHTGAAYGDGTPAWKVHGRRDDGGRSLADVVMETLAELLLAELSWNQEPFVKPDQFLAKLMGHRKRSKEITDIARKLFVAADVNGDKVFDKFDVGSKLSGKQADLLEQLAKSWRAKTAGEKLPDLTRPLHEQDKKEVFGHREEL